MSGMPDPTNRFPLRRRAVYGTVLLVALAVAAGLLAYDSLTRIRDFTPDSMNYVDVARNILAGHGVSQNTLGFNQVDFARALHRDVPEPLLVQPPVYPLLIAAVSLTGLRPADAALAIPAACYLLVLLLAYRLADRLYDRTVALTTLGLLLLHAPLARIGRTAWSEGPALVFLLACLLTLLRSTSGARRLLWTGLAGILAGLATDTRYALFPLLFAGPILFAVEETGWRNRVRSAGIYLLGFGAALAPVVIRMVRLGRDDLLHRDSFGLSLGRNLSGVLTALTGRNLTLVPSGLETALFGALLVTLLVMLGRRGGFREQLGRLFLSRRRFLLPLWAGLYLSFLVQQATRHRIDALSPRLVAPASVVLAIAVAALLVRGLRLRESRAAGFLAVVIAAVLGARIATAVTLPRVTDEARILQSPRLSWIADHTGDRDLVVGDDTVYIPFYFGRPAVSFSPYPNQHPTAEELTAFANRRRKDYDRFFLVLRDRFAEDSARRTAYGDFIADLVERGPEAFPGFQAVAELPDGRVYRIGTVEDQGAGGLRGLVDTVGFATTAAQMDSVVAQSLRSAAPRRDALRAETDWADDTPLAAAVCPHDDYAYAGRLYALLAPHIRARTVILFGVFHKARVFDCRDRLVFDSFDAWHGPHGPVRVSPLRDRLLARLPEADYLVDDDMQSVEHSIEGIVPWLQAFDPDVEIVPVLVPYMDWETLDGLAGDFSRALAAIMEEEGWRLGSDVALVASADAIHYGDAGWGGSDFAAFGTDIEGYARAVERDRDLAASTLTGPLRRDRLREFMYTCVDPNDVMKYELTWCGRFSIPFGLDVASRVSEALEGHGLTGTLLDYGTSVSEAGLDLDAVPGLGVTAPNNLHHWVGYAAIGYR